MADIVDISAGFNNQLVRVVQHHRSMVGYEQPTGTPPRFPRTHLRFGFLTSALAASTDPRLPWDDQPTATALIYSSGPDGLLVATDDEVTIYSRRDTAFVTDTFVEFQWKWSKWQLVDANCSATDLTQDVP